jgi:hypothetical protein
MSNLKMPNLLEKEEKKQTGLPMPVLKKTALIISLVSVAIMFTSCPM